MYTFNKMWNVITPEEAEGKSMSNVQKLLENLKI
jgi:hypothetical protein